MQFGFTRGHLAIGVLVSLCAQPVHALPMAGSANAFAFGDMLQRPNPFGFGLASDRFSNRARHRMGHNGRGSPLSRLSVQGPVASADAAVTQGVVKEERESFEAQVDVPQVGRFGMEMTINSPRPLSIVVNEALEGPTYRYSLVIEEAAPAIWQTNPAYQGKANAIPSVQLSSVPLPPAALLLGAALLGLARARRL